MAGMARNGWKMRESLDMTGNGWKWQEMTGNVWNGIMGELAEGGSVAVTVSVSDK